jgi:hypothetical protein
MGKLDKIIAALKRGIEIDDEEDNKNVEFLAPNLNDEREQHIVDEFIKRVKKMKMNAVAIMMLQTYKPVSNVFGQVYGVFFAPFLEVVGFSGYDYALVFRKRKNIEKIINELREDS